MTRVKFGVNSGGKTSRIPAGVNLTGVSNVFSITDFVNARSEWQQRHAEFCRRQPLPV